MRFLLSKVRAETASKVIKATEKVEEELFKEYCKKALEDKDDLKKRFKDTEFYNNMVNRLDSLEERMYNRYQKFKDTSVGCAVNNSLCRVISKVDDVMQLVNKRNTVKQIPPPFPHQQSLKILSEYILQNPIFFPKMMAKKAELKQTPPTPPREQSSKLEAISSDTSSLSSPEKLPSKKTGGKSQERG